MSKPLQTIRKFSLWLMVSGVCNIATISLLVYFWLKEQPPRPYFESKPTLAIAYQAIKAERTNKELIYQMKEMTPQELITRLADKQHIENGYTVRDLALGALVTFHHFHLEQSLSGQALPEQQRIIVYGKRQDGKPAQLLVFPGMNEARFQAILSYATTEKWPYTAKGLFNLLRREREPLDQTLVDAWMTTPEFLAVETLLMRADPKLEPLEIVKLLAEGDWKTVTQFREEQKREQDISPERRHRFLLDYLDLDSRKAAELMLRLDPSYTYLKLDDHHILKILTLLRQPTVDAKRFAKALLVSPRSNAVRQGAAVRLYAWEGEKMPDPYDHQAALGKFLSKSGIKATALPVLTKSKVIAVATPVTAEKVFIPKKQERLHVVQEGESLWKIAKSYKVDIDTIKKTNKLKSDLLKPGTILKIYPND